MDRVTSAAQPVDPARYQKVADRLLECTIGTLRPAWPVADG
ncbi:hypothetical protein ACQPXH_00680 [Nocardia sp. CA-135953]